VAEGTSGPRRSGRGDDTPPASRTLSSPATGRTVTLDDELHSLGFAHAGDSRRGGRQWALEFNRFLTITLHDFSDHMILTWSFRLGDYLLERGWQIGAAETSFQELYPRSDVKLDREIGAVEAEITRVLGTLRLDLGTPNL